MSLRGMFLLFGMAPKHISLHRDNYLNDGNLSTP
jgi:hypothetical protein